MDLNNYRNSILRANTEQLNALLNNCESEIEKCFLIKLISFIIQRPHEFSYSFLCDPLEGTTFINGKEYFKHQMGYYKDAHWGVNIYALKINKNDGTVHFIVSPQKEVFVEIDLEKRRYRLDFLIEKYSAGSRSHLLHSYCIECDGHEFHSTKDQISSDNMRAADLLLINNLSTIRFSGSQLYKWAEDEIGKFLFNL